MYKECKNTAELHHVGLDKGYYMDFCAMHNHMLKTGIPLKCWRCGDKQFTLKNLINLENNQAEEKREEENYLADSINQKNLRFQGKGQF